MATIYRFIVQDQQSKNAGQFATDVNGAPVPRGGAGSRGFNLGGMFGGTEHNRYMRPINSIMNRFTGGYWEKGVRATKAINNAISVGVEKNSLGAALGSVGFAILVQMLLIMVMNAFEEQQRKSKEENQSNFLKIKTGQTVLGNDYKISRDIFGKNTYSNQ